MSEAFEEYKKNKNEKAYKGLVNLEVMPLSNGNISIRHYCFNCKSEEFIYLDLSRQEDRTTFDSEKFKRNIKKKFEPLIS